MVYAQTPEAGPLDRVGLARRGGVMVSRRVRWAMLIGVLGAAGALLWARREAASEQPICTMPPEDMELQNTVWDAPMDRDTGRAILQAIAEGLPGADLTPTPHMR